MKSEYLRAAFGKIQWATTQIEQLDRQIEAYFRDEPFGLSCSVEPDGPCISPIKVWRIQHRNPVPDSIYSQVSVVLSLLREPLDQAVSAVSASQGRSEAGQSFIFGKTKQEFSTSISKSKSINSDVAQLILECEPFYGGKGQALAVLHYLKNPDKHRSPLVAIMLDVTTYASVVEVYNGQILTNGPRSGLHLKFNQRTRVLEQTDPDLQPIFHQEKKGNCLIFKPDPNASPKDRMEFATSELSAEIKADIEPKFSITLTDTVNTCGTTIIESLSKMRVEVEDVLKKFEEKFFLIC